MCSCIMRAAVQPISITVATDDSEDMITDLSSIFARMNINISEAKCLGGGQAINTFKCGVVDVEQLKGVHRVERTNND